jgi:hypothetical protein
MADNSPDKSISPLTVVRRWVAPVAVPAVIALAIAAFVDRVDPDTAPRKAARPAGGAAEAPVPTLMSKNRPLPRYVVGAHRSGSALAVRDVRTFAALGEVKVPADRRFQQVAAAGAGSYVVSASSGSGTVFYRLRLARNGKPQALTALPRVRIPGTSTRWSDLAISQDGGTIAYVSYGTGKIAIDVVSIATGTRRTWTTSLSGRIGSLSWAGRTLSFVWTPTRRGAAVRHQIRTLNTTLPGGGLKVSRPVLTLPNGAYTAVLSRDGRTIVTGLAGRSGLTLAAYSAATGRQTKVLWHRPEGQFRVTRLVPDRAGGDLIAGGPGGRLLVAPAHGAADFTAPDLADLAW